MSQPMVQPAGLPSGLAHIAHDRWDPIKESYDFTEHVSEHRVRSQGALPMPNLHPAYSNEDIEHSHPTSRPILACAALPRAFKVGSRCINPLEPRYVLPGTSTLTMSASSPKPSSGGAAGSPRAGAFCSFGGSAGGAGSGPLAAEPSGSFSGGAPSGAGRVGSERLLPMLTVPRSADVPRQQPLASPSGALHAHGDSSPAATPKQSQWQQQQQQQSALGVTTNGAMGGLLLYGPTATSPTALTPVSAGDRCLDVSDINGNCRSSSVPPRRGGFDNLNVSDIVPPRRASPARTPGCLTTADVRGATVRARTRDVPSPGAGTLSASDIPGAAPGCLTRASPSTYALGRWPAPSVATYHFAHSTRVTLLKKPAAIGARLGES